MDHLLQFHWRAYDAIQHPFRADAISVFKGRARESTQRVTDKDESETVRWLLRTLPARELLFSNLGLPGTTYAQTSVVEPLLDHTKKRRKPGDLDLLLLPSIDDPSRAISVQVKRVKVKALTAYVDDVSNRQLGNLTDLVAQANGSREYGFHMNYAMVVVQTDGAERSNCNVLARTATPGQFRRIYKRVWDSPLHPDVGVIFFEISQPTSASVDDLGTVAVCVDKRAALIDQPTELTAKLRQLTKCVVSL